jgi:aldehyde dehydrogenase (NAD+)
VYTQVVEELARRAQRIKVGTALDQATQMGPHSHAEQLEKTFRYFAIGRDEGARLVTGGERLRGDSFGAGYYVAPTVFADVQNSMRIAQEEIFGPVVAVIPFDTEEEALALANNTEYGLVAGLWTQNLGRAHRIAARIEAGMVWVNTYRFIRWSFPYGGMKVSGLGRENGPEVLEHFTETKTTVVHLTGDYPDMYSQ